MKTGDTKDLIEEAKAIWAKAEKAAEARLIALRINYPDIAQKLENNVELTIEEWKLVAGAVGIVKK